MKKKVSFKPSSNLVIDVDILEGMSDEKILEKAKIQFCEEFLEGKNTFGSVKYSIREEDTLLLKDIFVGGVYKEEELGLVTIYKKNKTTVGATTKSGEHYNIPPSLLKKVEEVTPEDVFCYSEDAPFLLDGQVVQLALNIKGQKKNNKKSYVIKLANKNAKLYEFNVDSGTYVKISIDALERKAKETL